jgi:Na+-transporting NADH:ubiquinone oxidoreductase subunit C
MIQFWLSEQGYKPYLDELREESGATIDNADAQASQANLEQAKPTTELAAALPLATGKEA